MKNKIIFFFSVLSFLSANAQTATELYDSAAVLQYQNKDYAGAAVLYEKAFKLPQPYLTYWKHYQAALCYAYLSNNNMVFNYLEQCRKLGWIDINLLYKDSIFLNLKNDNRWSAFEKAIIKDRNDFMMSINPYTHGLVANNFIQKIPEWENNNLISADSLYKKLIEWNQYPTPIKKGITVKYSIQSYEGEMEKLIPSYFVYIPKNYDPGKPNSIMMYIGGGWWGRPQYHAPETKDFLFENPTFTYLEKYNLIEIYPVLASPVSLERPEGYSNIERIVVDVKKTFNINDNRVFLCGFSDGGSSAYNIAANNPTQFAKFYPINGWLNGYRAFSNFSNRPIFSYSAQYDFYSNAAMLTRAAFAIKLGADWVFNTVPGQGHLYYPYNNLLLPTIFNDMQLCKSRGFNNKITWFVSDNFIGGCDWLKVIVDSARNTTPEHFSDSLHSFNMDGDKNLLIEYGKKFAQTTADYGNNTFTISSSKVVEITLLISPEMVDITKPVKVILNGKEVFNKKIEIDRSFMVQNFLEYFDRKRVWVNKIVLQVE